MRAGLSPMLLRRARYTDTCLTRGHILSGLPTVLSPSAGCPGQGEGVAAPAAEGGGGGAAAQATRAGGAGGIAQHQHTPRNGACTCRTCWGSPKPFVLSLRLGPYASRPCSMPQAKSLKAKPAAPGKPPAGPSAAIARRPAVASAETTAYSEEFEATASGSMYGGVQPHRAAAQSSSIVDDAPSTDSFGRPAAVRPGSGTASVEMEELGSSGGASRSRIQQQTGGVSGSGSVLEEGSARGGSSGLGHSGGRSSSAQRSRGGASISDDVYDESFESDSVVSPLATCPIRKHLVHLWPRWFLHMAAEFL